MKTKLNLLGCATAIALLAGVSSASADIIDVTWTGTVGYFGTGVTDTNNIFGAGAGASLAGDTFTATFVYDTATAGANYSLGSNVQNLSGGSNINGSRFPGVPSPLVSASITINGTTVLVSGAAQSGLSASFGGPTGAGGNATSSFLTDAFADAANTTYLRVALQGVTPGPVSGFPIGIDQDGTYTIGDGVQATATSDFVTGGEGIALSAQTVTVDVQSVAAVPEPSTWAMMFLGFAGLGLLSYRRNQRKGGLNFRLV